MKKTVLFLACSAAAVLCAADPAVQPATSPKALTTPAAAVKPAATVQAAPAAAVQTAPKAQPAPAAAVQVAPKKEEPGMGLCLARGLCNITTGVLEIPRCVVYDNGFIPVFGTIVGIPEGAFLTIGRIFCGLYDIVSFGTSGSTCHGEVFPDTVFQAKWIYRK